MLENPFTVIDRRFNRLESLLVEIKGIVYSMPPASVEAKDNLTLQEVAEEFGVSESLLYRDPKRWGGQKVAGKWRFRRSELNKIFAGGGGNQK